MKPLGARTYLRRNTKKTLPLVGVIVLAVMLICAIVSLINSIPLSVRTIFHYTSAMMAVTPRGDASLTPILQKEIEKGTPVPIERVVVCRASEAQVKSIVGPWNFAVIALANADMKYMLGRLGSTRLEGRLPENGKPEAVISNPVARNLKLKIGDTVLSPEKTDGYSPMPVKVVGIAQTNEWLIFADIDYYRVNHFPPIDLLLVCSKDIKSQPLLDSWAVDHFKGARARILTYGEIEKEANGMFDTLYKILDIVIGTLVIVITVMMGMLINIHLSQRTQEFALLQALGYSKASMIKRVIVETMLVVGSGWILGIGAAIGMLQLAKIILMDPNAFALDIVDAAALRYTVPVPVAILIVAMYTLWAKFRTFDPVGVVERRLV